MEQTDTRVEKDAFRKIESVGNVGRKRTGGYKILISLPALEGLPLGSATTAVMGGMNIFVWTFGLHFRSTVSTTLLLMLRLTPVDMAVDGAPKTANTLSLLRRVLAFSKLVARKSRHDDPPVHVRRFAPTRLVVSRTSGVVHTPQ